MTLNVADVYELGLAALAAAAEDPSLLECSKDFDGFMRANYVAASLDGFDELTVEEKMAAFEALFDAERPVGRNFYEFARSAVLDQLP